MERGRSIRFHPTKPIEIIAAVAMVGRVITADGGAAGGGGEYAKLVITPNRRVALSAIISGRSVVYPVQPPQLAL